MQTETYFNTTGLAGQELQQAGQDSKKQNAVILTVFKENSDKYVSPFYIKSIVDARMAKDILIGNVRRSITTLTKQGLLEKSDKPFLMGVYGKVNYGWKLKEGLAA